MLKEFIEYLSGLYLKKGKSPAVAYDLWASTYDDQPGSLMMDFDEEIFNTFLQDISVTGKTVVDIGCGTGRHWKELHDKSPKRLVGYDVSVNMLKRLQAKFPEAETHLLTNHHLHGLEDDSCDLLFSSLTISHIEDIEQTFKEWDRVLKPGAEVMIIDYHPELLAKGTERTFKYRNKTIVIRTYVHSIEKIKSFSRQLKWQEIHFIEKRIDEGVHEYYKNQYAYTIYEKFKGTAIIYGIHLKKAY